VSCEKPELKQQLYRFVRHELESEDDQRQVVAHLETCAECRAVFAELQWVMGALRPSSPEEHAELMKELRRVGNVGTEADAAAPKTAGDSWVQRLKRWLSSGGGA